MQSEVCLRVKNLRQLMGVSYEEMASSMGISVLEYKDFEQGSIELSFSILMKCADRLSVSVGEILTGEAPKLDLYDVTRKDQGMKINRRQGFDYLHIAPEMKNRLAEPVIVTAKYSEKEENAPIKQSIHSGQELNYVLSGSIKIQIDRQIEILHAGDSIYYDATRNHGMVAIGGTDAVFLSVVINKGESYDYVQPKEPVRKKAAPIEIYDQLVYKKFVEEDLDEENNLKDIRFQIPENFNFAVDVVDEIAKKTPDKTAMVWVSKDHEERKFSFADIEKYSKKTAAFFQSLGIQKGDVVMISVKRHYQFWFSIIALHRLGAIALPAANTLSKKDFVYRFNAANVKAVVATTDGDLINSINQALPDSSSVAVKILVNNPARNSQENPYESMGWIDFEKMNDFEASFEPVEVHKNDPMLMYFTSGTTGYPKIAVHNFTYPVGHIVTARWWQNVSPDGIHFTISDTGWGKAVWGKLYGQWFCEAAVFTYDFDKFEATDILPLFAKHKITSFCAPPTMYRFFIKENLANYDLSSCKHASIAGEALNPEVFQQFYNATGLKPMEGFGQTETTLTLANLSGTEPKPGSMGKPSPQYKVTLLTPEGQEAKVGQVGEIVINTAEKPCGLFDGYYNPSGCIDKELTEKVWHDGYYHTGDMAWRDEEGYYWYVGRTDDLIKSSGYRIGPFEVESVIMELPYVLECAVTGVDDPVRGQVVKATVVLVNDKKPADEQQAEELKLSIQNYVKKHTAPYKYPRIVEFVDNLPKTISGKIRRVELREKDK